MHNEKYSTLIRLFKHKLGLRISATLRVQECLLCCQPLILTRLVFPTTADRANLGIAAALLVTLPFPIPVDSSTSSFLWVKCGGEDECDDEGS
jgi:hypothetical protein